MADFFRGMIGEVQKGEGVAAKRTLYIEVNTAEAQVVTVSKQGAAFGATGGTTCTAVVGTLYKLILHAADIDAVGQVAFLCTGATDAQRGIVEVREYDPYTQGAKSDAVLKYQQGVP